MERSIVQNPSAMNSLNATATIKTGRHLSIVPSLNPHRPFYSNPISSLGFRFPSPPLSRHLSLATVKASLQRSTNEETSNGRSKFLRFMPPEWNIAPVVSWIPFLAPLKATLVTTIVAAAISFSGLYFPLKPVRALVNSAPPTVEKSEEDPVMEEETEKLLEEQFRSNRCDVEGLRSLMELKIKSQKIPEAIELLNKLIELEPEEAEWPLMKSHLYAYNGDYGKAKKEFNELIKKDPFRVEAYHGLVSVASQEESTEELRIIEKRIEDAIKLCRKENKKKDIRDFNLLLAQIRVLEGRYDSALKVYEELVEEEPRDFRPYLCQGIIYTLLRKNNEAEKSFEKYRRLVPKGHPYASYFNDNMIATKLFAQRMENERAAGKV